jgi:ribosomal RNA-processing protein 9
MSYVETLFGHQAPVTSIDCLGQERPLTAGGFDRSIRLFKVHHHRSRLVYCVLPLLTL